MRLLNLQQKMISVLLIIALILPSCSVYKKSPSTLDEAIAANNRILIVNTDNSTYKFNRIIQIDQTYYGEIKTVSGTEKMPLSETKIKSIHVLDNKKTTKLNLKIIASPVFIVLAVIAFSDYDKLVRTFEQK